MHFLSSFGILMVQLTDMRFSPQKTLSDNLRLDIYELIY